MTSDEDYIKSTNFFILVQHFPFHNCGTPTQHIIRSKVLLSFGI